MMKIDKIILYSLVAIVAIMVSVMLKKSTQKSKIAYIDIGKMLDGYKFKKDLENVGTKNLYAIKNSIDSLKMLKKVNAGSQLDTQIFNAENAFDKYYNLSNQEITKKIWERLNPLLELYGKEHNLDLVIGANGAGNVLYGDTQMDITNDVVQYINQHYEKAN